MSSRLRVLVGDLGNVPADFPQHLEQEGFAVTGIVKTEQLINSGDPPVESDVVLLFALCIDDVVLRVVEQLVSESGKPVAVLCEDASREAIQSAVSAGVSAYAVSKSRVQTAVNLAVANHSCTSEKEELDEDKQALLERRIVERAKLIVMARRYLDEAAAHMLLRTRAVQRGMRLADLARALANADDLVT